MRKQLLLVTLIFCAACSRSSNDAHYAQLEQNRDQQASQQRGPTTPAAVPSPSPSASVAASPGETPAAPAAPSRNSWTNFRGARRDGKYDEGAVSTHWPANGL